MRWLPAAASVVTAVSCVLVTAWAGWPAGILVGVVVAVATAVAVVAVRDRRVERLTADVAAWAGGDAVPQFRPNDDPALAALAVALADSAEVLARRVSRAEREPPWRRDLVAALPTAAVLFDPDGYLAAANQPARDLLGIAADDEPTTVLKALGSARLADTVRSVSDGDEPVEIDAEVSGRVVRAVVTTIGAQRLVLVTDRTRERRVENLRRNFVVNASHELKTPVTSIQALTEALSVMVERDPERLPPLVARLGEESTRLVRVVHDLLDLRRLEDRVHVEPEPVDVVPVVAEATDGLAEGAANRAITVAVDTPAHAFAHCDPDDLRIIVRNLVGNGIQYNRDGGSLDVTVSNHEGTVVLVVADTGLGIPKADLARVFERFYRVDVARSRQTGGTGLGLSLVRNAVSRNGGTVELESLLGAGSTFTVRLPSARPRLAVPAGADPDEHVPLVTGPSVPDVVDDPALS